MIPLNKIQSLSTRLSVPDATIEKDYILSWILIGIARSKIKSLLIFKGGTALKKFYIEDYRFSEDLDFTLLGDMSLQSIKIELDCVFRDILSLANIQLVIHAEETKRNTYTFFINYSGPLGADMSKRDIKMDITIKELCLFKPQDLPLMKEYDEYYDLDYKVKIIVYDIKEIFVEKLCCLLHSARNEARDVYDVWFLLDHLNKDEHDECIDKYKEKVKYREINGANLETMINNKEKLYEKTWAQKLKYQINDLPEFNGVYRQLKSKLKQLGYYS